MKQSFKLFLEAQDEISAKFQSLFDKIVREPTVEWVKTADGQNNILTKVIGKVSNDRTSSIFISSVEYLESVARQARAKDGSEHFNCGVSFKIGVSENRRPNIVLNTFWIFAFGLELPRSILILPKTERDNTIRNELDFAGIKAFDNVEEHDNYLFVMGLKGVQNEDV